jgi:hypothetical protein
MNIHFFLEAAEIQIMTCLMDRDHGLLQVLRTDIYFLVPSFQTRTTGAPSIPQII